MSDETRVLQDAGFSDDSFRERYVLELPATVERGGILTVTLGGPRAISVQGEIAFANGRVVESHGWRGAGAAGQKEGLWYVLIGIPSNAPLGEAYVRLALLPGATTWVAADRVKTGERGVRVFTEEVRIVDRDFLSEVIPLNAAMSTLRSEEDPRKTEESRILWELLHTTDLSARYHTGRFIMPLSSFRYTSHYGDRRTYAYTDGSSAGAIHNGLDMAVPTGTPVAAVGRGRVQMATDRIVTGLTVVIEHLPSVYSLYYHLDSINVRHGDVVGVGEIIGTVGSTGLSTGPHLHWELRVSGVAVDPMTFVERPRIDIGSLRRSLLMAP